MMPHMIGSLRGSQNLLELGSATVGRVLDERPLAGPPADAPQGVVGLLDRRRRLVARLRHQNLVSRLEELIESGPRVGQDRGATRGGFEQAAGRAVAGG